MRPVNLEHIGASWTQATGISGRVIRSASAGHASAKTTPFGMVENIEGFTSELDGESFLDGEVLEQRHVKVDPARIGYVIST